MTADSAGRDVETRAHLAGEMFVYAVSVMVLLNVIIDERPNLSGTCCERIPNLCWYLAEYGVVFRHNGATWSTV